MRQSRIFAPDLLDGIHVYKGVDYSHQLKVYQLVHQTSGLPDYYEDKPKNGVSLSGEIKRGRDRARSGGYAGDHA